MNSFDYVYAIDIANFNTKQLLKSEDKQKFNSSLQIILKKCLISAFEKLYNNNVFFNNFQENFELLNWMHGELFIIAYTLIINKTSLNTIKDYLKYISDDIAEFFSTYKDNEISDFEDCQYGDTILAKSLLKMLQSKIMNESDYNCLKSKFEQMDSLSDGDIIGLVYDFNQDYSLKQYCPGMYEAAGYILIVKNYSNGKIVEEKYYRDKYEKSLMMKTIYKYKSDNSFITTTSYDNEWIKTQNTDYVEGYYDSHGRTIYEKVYISKKDNIIHSELFCEYFDDGSFEEKFLEHHNYQYFSQLSDKNRRILKHITYSDSNMTEVISTETYEHLANGEHIKKTIYNIDNRYGGKSSVEWIDGQWRTYKGILYNDKNFTNPIKEINITYNDDGTTNRLEKSFK